MTPGEQRQRDALIQANRRRVWTPEMRLEISKRFKGYKHSAATCDKMSAKAKGRTHTQAWKDDMRQQMLGKQMLKLATIKGECVYCFAPAQTIDHVIPTKRGGLDTAENRVPCCASCNSSKRNRTPDEWFADQCECWRCVEAKGVA